MTKGMKLLLLVVATPFGLVLAMLDRALHGPQHGLTVSGWFAFCAWWLQRK